MYVWLGFGMGKGGVQASGVVCVRVAWVRVPLCVCACLGGGGGRLCTCILLNDYLFWKI